DAETTPLVQEANVRDEDLAAQAGSVRREQGIGNRSGVALFEHCLALQQPRVLVSILAPQDRQTGQRLAVAAGVPSGLVHGGPAAPPGSITEQLASILRRLLGVSDVGTEDDFFALGGDSLIGAQFVAQASRLLGTRLTLRDLFNAPTIAGLAAQVAHAAAPLPT